MQEGRQKNCFDVFADIAPQKRDLTVQVLYEYEKYYMDLVRKYRPEIQLLKELLEQLRTEQVAFYSDQLPTITRKLEEDAGIDETARREWLNRLTQNMDRSFELSTELIRGYMLKDIEEFRAAVREKLGV